MFVLYLEGSAFQSTTFTIPMKLQSSFVNWEGAENPSNKIVLKGNGELPNVIIAMSIVFGFVP